MFTDRIPVLGSMASQAQVYSTLAIELEPQDEDSILIAWHQEGRQDGNEEPEHEERPAQPAQPEPRRSARIKAMKDGALPKPKSPPNRQAESVPLGRSSLATLRDD